MSLAPEFSFFISTVDPPLLTRVGKQQNTIHPFYVAHTTMAEATTPTFKLVLVGDGGTGKVTHFSSSGLRHEY